MHSKTLTLVANTNTKVLFGTESFDGFTVYNHSATVAYINVDSVAVLEGGGCVIVPANAFRTITHRGKVLNVISSGTPKLEVLGLRT